MSIVDSQVLIDRCSTFELRGPTSASVSRVDRHIVSVVRPETDWSPITGGKPVTDNRNASMADLFPRPRDLMNRLLKGVESSRPEQAAKPRSPRMG